MEIGLETAQFKISREQENWSSVGAPFAPSGITSDSFTGTFVGIACQDGLFHRHSADFDFFSYEPVCS